MAFATLTSMFFLLLLPLFAIAQTTNGRVDLGKSLTAAANKASSWLSSSAEFAFGFHRPDNNEDRFLLSIWFDKIPEKTVVWSAYKDGGPVLAQSGSKVQLTAEDGLVLSDPQGAELWKSEISAQEVAYGVMNNTGNFAIFGSRDSDQLWQSFDHPTDTLLPTQVMKIDGFLFSRHKENDFSQGRFQLRLNGDGNLVLNSVNGAWVYKDPYYSSGTNGTSNSGIQLNFNESADVYVFRTNGQRSPIVGGTTLPSPSSELYLRVTLEFDGVFAQYYYPKQSTGSTGGWSTLWSRPEDICSRVSDIGSGVCGPNSICKLNGNRPSCECLPGFSLLDSNDNYGGCKREGELDCDDGLEAYEIQVLEGINFAFNDYEVSASNTEEYCKTACLHDCMCAVAIYGSNGNCWKKRLPVSNGRYEDYRTKALIKVRKGYRPPTDRNPSIPGKDKKKENLHVTAFILFGTSAFVNLAFIAAFWLAFLVIYKKKPSMIQQQSQLQRNLQFFTYKELLEATDGFREELGRGAFGVVYQGTMQMAASGSRTNIAVKKLLDGVVQDGDKEFKTEINVIGQTHHKNLVRLLGFCDEGKQRLLVYEFLSNGTLADYLFGNRKPLWNQRTQIALGIARGLLYLHEECCTQIIHCDIKPQNILLDDYYNVRISDFGLSKLLMMDQTQTKTAIRGTKGYVAPEWFRNLPVTVKVDVYSFGVILLEIICCRRSVVNEEIGDGEFEVLTYLAYDCYLGGKIEDLVSDDMEAINDMENLEKFLMVGFWCIQEDPYLRPTMRKVTQMLEGVVQVNIPPNPSPFSTMV